MRRIIGFTTAMLLCVALAFCQEERQNVVTFGKFTIYEVNKSVADFEKGDMSSPEALYATFNKIAASRDRDVLATMSDYNVDKRAMSCHSIRVTNIMKAGQGDCKVQNRSAHNR